MGVQAFIAEPPIERFHKGIVSRLSRPREVQRYAVFIRPAIQGLRDKLRAIVHTYGPWSAAYRCDPVHGLDDLLPFDTLVDVDRQSLPGLRIDNGQGTQAPTIEQGIRDEVHRPQLVRGQRRWLSLPLSRADMPTRPFEP